MYENNVLTTLDTDIIQCRESGRMMHWLVSIFWSYHKRFSVDDYDKEVFVVVG